MTTLKDIGPDAAWDAVQRRDPGFDGRVLYAVTTTGIYCKPSCPARRPRRANVRFFSDHETAGAAGFRPCKRCRPDGEDPAGEIIRRAQAYLHDHLDDGVTLKELGREVGMSPTHLQRTFKARVGISPKEYVRAVRTKRLKAALRDGDSSVTRTAFDAGFGSASATYAATDAHLGMTPATYGAGGHGAHIRYAVLPCQFGYLLAAVTARGVCAVTLGNPPAALERALRVEFPMATIEREQSGELHALCERIVQHAPGTQAAADQPLDVRGTAFQWEVWRHLRGIPAGTTRSYQEVATAVGRPTAVRAVARACASNHVALLIPCHRVVRNDGSLGGYKWGTERKQAILDAERHLAPAV